MTSQSDGYSVEFHDLALQLLGIKPENSELLRDLQVVSSEGPSNDFLPLPRWTDTDSPYLTTENLRELGLIVRDLAGVTLETWEASNPGEKLACMRTAWDKHLAAQAAPASKPNVEPAKASRLRIDIDRTVLVLDGDEHVVNSTQALRFLQVLLDNEGKTISSSDLKGELVGARADRLRKMLPPEVQKLIEGKPGSGFCLRL